MATKIEWTDETWGPTLGCERVSPGCDGCYAIREANMHAGHPNQKIAGAFAGLTHRTERGLDWTGVVRLMPERLDKPLRWRKPRRIFVDSQSDLFHQAVPDEFLARVFAVMATTPQHTYQILTKRHGRMRSLLGSRRFFEMVAAAVRVRGEVYSRELVGWPLPNVWLGVSVEDQKRAELRIPALLDTPAAVRFLSCEPLLRPVDLSQWLTFECPACFRRGQWINGRATDAGDLIDEFWCQVCGAESALSTCAPPGISWVIVGGESGPGARPMHPDWVRHLRDQCVASGVPFHFKQWGDWSPIAPLDAKGRFDFRGAHALADDGTLYQASDLSYPDGPRYGEAIRAGHDKAHLTSMYRVGKKTAGRELDGRVWDEFPAVAA